MSKDPSLVWLPTCCAEGPRQMAVDEALLLATGSDQVPRLRFYYWSAPTISLGYFQDYNAFLAAFPKFSSFSIVRRLTGGGAILHDREITYCLTLPASHSLYKAGPIAAYTLVHQAIADCLEPLGLALSLRPKDPNYARVRDEPEFCFARPCPTDLVHPTGKLVGSAQRRLPTAFLQHGSIMLENRFPEQPTTTLTGLLPAVPPNAELESLFAAELERKMATRFIPRDLTVEEFAAADRLTAKYAGTAWTIDRQCSDR